MREPYLRESCFESQEHLYPPDEASAGNVRLRYRFLPECTPADRANIRSDLEQRSMVSICTAGLHVPDTFSSMLSTSSA